MAYTIRKYCYSSGETRETVLILKSSWLNGNILRNPPPDALSPKDMFLFINKFFWKPESVILFLLSEETGRKKKNMIRIIDEVSIELPKFPSFSNLGIFSQIIIYASFNICSMHIWVSLVAQMVKNLPAVWETWIRSLGWEDALEKEMQPTPVFWPGEVHVLYSPWGHKESDTIEWLSVTSILVWRILQTEEPVGLQSMGLQSQTWLSN